MYVKKGSEQFSGGNPKRPHFCLLEPDLELQLAAVGLEPVSALRLQRPHLLGLGNRHRGFASRNASGTRRGEQAELQRTVDDLALREENAPRAPIAPIERIATGPGGDIGWLREKRCVLGGNARVANARRDRQQCRQGEIATHRHRRRAASTRWMARTMPT